MIEITGRSIYDLARYRVLQWPLATIFLIDLFLAKVITAPKARLQSFIACKTIK